MSDLTMGDQDAPEGNPLSPEERLKILEQECRSHHEASEKADRACAEAKERISELAEELRQLNAQLDYRKDVQEFMDQRGRKLNELLNKHRPKDARAVIRTDELLLIARYNPDIAPDVELIEKFKAQGRSIDWWVSMIDDALLALDKAPLAGVQDLGWQLYKTVVRCQSQLSVVDIEAVVRYAFHAIPAGLAGKEQDAGALNDLASRIAQSDYMLHQDADLLAKARNVYRKELQAHNTHYSALDPTAKTLLRLRDTLYNQEWAAALKDLGGIEQMQKALAQKENVSIFGMPETDIKTLRVSIQAMQEHEKRYNINLNWFQELPRDLDAFASGH